MAANQHSIGLIELLDLAISSQDVGTINFNILRLLLEDMVKKLSKIDKEPLKLGDHDANQVSNYKKYIEGAPVSPMPGVMRYTPGKTQPVSDPAKQSTPMTSKSGKPPAPGAPDARAPSSHRVHETSKPEHPSLGYQAASMTSPGSESQPSIHPDHGPIKELQDKVGRLEKQLDSLNQLPNNEDLLHKSPKDKEGMSVNDMWQLIQLNNRIAAVEAGLQKMASLIEDLAKEFKKVRSDTNGIQTQADNLAHSNTQLAMKVSPISDKHNEAERKLNDLKHEVEKVKTQLNLLENATGVDPKKVPTFMKKAGKPRPGAIRKEHLDQPSALDPSDDTAPSGGGAHLTPDQIAGLTPQQLFKLDPSAIASLTPNQVAHITHSQMNDMSPEQREQIDKIKRQAHTAHRHGPDVNKMTAEQLSSLTPAQINSMTPEEIAKIRPSKIALMSPSQVKLLEKVKRGKGPDLNAMTAKDISRVPISELAKLSPSQVSKISPAKLEQMSAAQRKQIEKMKQSHGPNLTDMSPHEISQVPISDLQKLTPAQLANITPSKLEHMTTEQKKEIEEMKQRSRSPSPSPNYEGMSQQQVIDIPLSQISKMSSNEAASISPDVIAMMTPEQRRLLEERKNSEMATAADLKNMSPDDIALISVEDLSKLTPDEIDKISPSVLALMTPEQRHRLEAIVKGKYHTPNFEGMSADEIARISLSSLSNLTPNEIENISPGVREHMTPEQLQILEEILIAGNYYGDQDHGEGFSDTDPLDRSSQDAGPSEKRRQKAIPQRFRGKKGQRIGSVTEEPVVGDEDMLEKEDSLEIPKPVLGEHQEILTMEDYLASLPKEEIENMAADAVEQELQKQYANLQGMQRKLAQDIQDKMETVYQKLLREIITQQLTTSPYTVIDGQEKCLGPGICKGHGMPAGIAVCQYPETNENRISTKAIVGDADCPACGKNFKNSEPPRPTVLSGEVKPKANKTAADPSTEKREQEGIKDLKSMDVLPTMSLDLDRIREDMKTSNFGVFDEKDILERLGTLWEAVKVLKTNEEALTSRLTKHETLLKKLPAKAMNKQGVGDYTESYNPAQLKYQLLNPGVAAVPSQTVGGNPGNSDQKPEEIDKDDIQTLFNNLANVIGECADQKERIDQLVDAVRIIESGMVTKQILIDSISDKADKGHINTKVSYDEFGNTVDELHTQLHNLMVEGYQRNENWKKVTADLAEELAEKLDKVELAPIRAFFKSRLKNLEDQMLTVSTLLQEPDPAGTRKKFLKNYNCISCDRRVNISGVTNTTILPTIGPAMSSSTSASHRTLDLHKLRSQRSRLDAEYQEIAALEKQVQSKIRGKEKSERPKSDKDVMNVVNRYIGSAPTTASANLPAMRIASQTQQQISRTSQLESRQSDLKSSVVQLQDNGMAE